LIEQFGKATASSVQPNFRRTDRTPQHHGRLRNVEVLPGDQIEHLLVSTAETPHCRLNEMGVSDAVGMVPVDSRRLRHQSLYVLLESILTLQCPVLVGKGVSCNRVQPGQRLRRDTIDPPPSNKKGVRHYILCIGLRDTAKCIGQDLCVVGLVERSELLLVVRHRSLPTADVAPSVSYRCGRESMVTYVVPILDPATRSDAVSVPRRGRALADVISPCHWAQVLLAAYGGLRIEELAGLRRGRVNLLRGTGDVADIIVEARATAKSPSDCSMQSIRHPAPDRHATITADQLA
jgi:hypothetical protein